MYLGMRPGDLDDKPYARHWNPAMAPLSKPVREALLLGPQASKLAFPLEEANRLLEPGDQDLENGWTRLANGQTFVAVRTPMPGVSAAMIDWWFGWHGVETQRYKLWHPRAHMGVRMKNPRADTGGITDRERYVGNVSYVVEYLGAQVYNLAIAFRDPGAYLDTSRFQSAQVGTAVCARTGLASRPLDAGHLIHLIQEDDEGCHMRSRFWLGDVSARFLGAANPVNRYILGSRFVARAAVEQQVGRDLTVHCASEMAHQASFLPALYADYHS
jgi:hypothetical protein